MFSEAELAVIWSVYSDLLTSLDPQEVRGRSFVDVERRVRRLGAELLRQSAPRWSSSARDKALAYLLDELFGLGPLEALLASPRVSEVKVISADEVRVVLDGRVTQTNVRFRDAGHLASVCARARALDPTVADVHVSGAGFSIRKLEPT